MFHLFPSGGAQKQISIPDHKIDKSFLERLSHLKINLSEMKNMIELVKSGTC
jgi:hypothetical protein